MDDFITWDLNCKINKRNGLRNKYMRKRDFLDLKSFLCMNNQKSCKDGIKKAYFPERYGKCIGGVYSYSVQSFKRQS